VLSLGFDLRCVVVEREGQRPEASFVPGRGSIFLWNFPGMPMFSELRANLEAVAFDAKPFATRNHLKGNTVSIGTIILIILVLILLGGIGGIGGGPFYGTGYYGGGGLGLVIVILLILVLMGRI
jgi:hypothetical protein